MKNKLFKGLVLFLALFVIVGCGRRLPINNNNNETNKKEEKTKANTTFGWIKLFIPEDYTYRPDLRGLIYSEDERKLFIKGDPYDRSTAIIIDLKKEEINMYFDQYVNKLNDNISDVKYKLIKENPQLYLREKYQGKSGETIVYNYTYLTIYNSYVYSITISGASTDEDVLNTLRSNIVSSLEVGK